MTEMITAYWFAAASDTLPNGDGRKIVIGETHSIEGGKIECCRRGLHWSCDPFDALQYATGPYLYRVEAWGDVQEQADKGCSRHRRYVSRIDATTVLRQFAREQGLGVVHLWDAPAVVRRYLETGDESIRIAAWDAAWDAVRDAARDAPRDAAREAAAWATAGDDDAAWNAARPGDAARERFNALVTAAFAPPK